MTVSYMNVIFICAAVADEACTISNSRCRVEVLMISHGAPNRNIGDAFLVIWRLSGAVQCCQMLSASFWERLVFKFYCSTMLDHGAISSRQLRRKTDEAG